MGERLDQPTPEQQDQLAAYRERWLAIGLATTPTDRARSERAIRSLYRLSGEDPPEFLWCESPRAAVEVVRGLDRNSIPWASIEETTSAALLDPIHALLWPTTLQRPFDEPVPTRLWKSFATSLAFAVWMSLSAEEPGGQELQDIEAEPLSALWCDINFALWDLVIRPLRGALQDTFGRPLTRREGYLHTADDSVIGWYWRGQQEAAWIAYCLFADDVLGLGYPPHRRAVLDLWTELAHCCGWWWPHRGLCVVAERPVRLSFEGRALSLGRTQVRLHNEHGAALEFPDGWGVWALHGVRVPRDVVEAPQQLPVDSILAETNVEVRRIMLERFGIGRFLAEAQAELLDDAVDGCGRPRRLWRIRMPNEPMIMLEVTNSTPETDGTYRRYLLRVPPECRTALEAVAWTWRIEPQEYVLDVES